MQHWLTALLALSLTSTQASAPKPVKQQGAPKRPASINPGTIDAAIATARDGEVLTLPPGDYGLVKIQNQKWADPITLDLRKASLRMSILNSSGIKMIGGTFENALGEGTDAYGIYARGSSDISLEGPLFRNSKRGLVVDRSHHITVTRATFTNLTVDGMNIAASQHVTVTDSECSAFVSQQISHPDCIQLWSRKDQGITSDVTLLRNRASGDMQGFTAFNGAQDGGFDRITVIGNYAATTYPQGVAIYGCRDCVVKDNVGVTPPGAKWGVVLMHAPNCIRCTVQNNKPGKRTSRR